MAALEVVVEVITSLLGAGNTNALSCPRVAGAEVVAGDEQ